MGEEEKEASNTQNFEKSTTNGVEEQDENALKFLDSMDSYLLLVESLSSTLRQGWLELASARHSMGASRVNSALLDLKHHSAATTLELHYRDGNSPQFTLSKWASAENEDCSLKKEHVEDEQLKEDSSSPKLGLNSSPRNSENQKSSKSNGTETNTSPRESNGSETNASPRKPDSPIQKERAKSLSMFGTLVSPKLRASQLSFETALDRIVEIANMRSSILEAHDRVQKQIKSNKE